jgi:hypothetical protein
MTTHMALSVRVKEFRVFELVRCKILAAPVRVEALTGLKKVNEARVGSRSNGVAPRVANAL